MDPQDFSDDPEVQEALRQFSEMSEEELQEYVDSVTDSMLDAAREQALEAGTVLQMAIGAPCENAMQCQTVSNVNGEIAGMLLSNQIAANLQEDVGMVDFCIALVSDLAQKVDGELLGLLGALMMEHADPPGDLADELLGTQEGENNDGPESLYEDF
jgi:hypothetical protein